MKLRIKKEFKKSFDNTVNISLLHFTTVAYPLLY